MISLGAYWRRLWITAPARRFGHLARLGREHAEGEDADDDALSEAEIEKRGLEAATS